MCMERVLPLHRCLVLAVWVVTQAWTPSAQATFAATDLVIPSVGHGPGAQGSWWRTTLWLSNQNSAQTTCEIQLLLRNQENLDPPSYRLVLGADEVRRIDDAVWSLFGLQAFGALRVTCDKAILASARIYNQPGADPRYSQGQFFAGVPESFAIGIGEATDVPGVNQGPDGDFRSNFGFVEVAGRTTTVEVELLDGDGTHLGSRNYTLRPLEAMQVSLSDLGLGARPTANGRLRVRVVGGSGRVLAFGSMVANGSQDASTLEMSLTAALPAKSKVYMRERSEEARDAGLHKVAAYCDDENDFPLQGVCIVDDAWVGSVYNGGGRPLAWGDPSAAAGWECSFWVGGVGLRYTAGIICLTVP